MYVLILILLEVGLLAIKKFFNNWCLSKASLNPYSTGSWVAGLFIFNERRKRFKVLILILLEVGLLVSSSLIMLRECSEIVLILILLEVGLLVMKKFIIGGYGDVVLILILLEVGLLDWRSY